MYSRHAFWYYKGLIMDLQATKNRFQIIGNAPNLNYALQTAITAAPYDLNILIYGDSGVGKENFSKIIHALSKRKHNGFMAINCGAIPEGTIDSELFGHEKGAFTGAIDARKGYFETVHEGTIFLDEIGELPLSTQSRLLRILENGEFIKVGASKVQKTNVRIIAATNKNLLDLAQQGKFREDLFYRLSTIQIKVPPLRERKEDILLLFGKFASDFAHTYNRQPIQLTVDAKEVVVNYYWKGNIRELKSFTEQLSILVHGTHANSQDILKFLNPNQNAVNQLPIQINSFNNSEFQNEREILYKYFFELKKDVIEMKKMFIELLNNPSFNQNETIQELKFTHPEFDPNGSLQNMQVIQTNQPFNIIRKKNVESDEPLNLSDKEKDFIVRALQKYKNHRGNAAQELGISERTLYRKIKEYNLENLIK
ncbi:MAG: sigma-54 dependent transcriptional regulator [Alphaproteobacteria bacterium]|nr:sigma-54 dependent transcriptional regulator [Alphaproteobacteria bacterium]